ncbi:MAG: hypothetical protein GXP43_00445 [bacterium]|nr:hypothetical protein [bacterium]
MKKRLFLIMGIGLIWGMMFGVGSVRAIEGMGVGMFPAHPNPKVLYSRAWLIYNLVPGESKRDEFIIVNKGKSPVELRLYPVDATITKDGAFTLLDEKAGRKGVGGWIKLDVDRVKLAPNEEKRIGFVFSVPKGTEVGDHMGGIIAEKTGQGDKNSALRIKTRIGLRVYETVPGDLVRELEVGGFKASYEEKTKKLPGRLRLMFSLKNVGNVHLNPMADVELINNFNGRGVKSRKVSLGTIFPGMTSKVPVVWDDVPWWGSFVVKAKVMYDRDLADMYVVKQSEVFYISNKAKFLAASAVVLLLVLVSFGLVGREIRGTGRKKKKR